MKSPGQVLDIDRSTPIESDRVLVHPRNSPASANQKWRIVKPLVEIITF
jgi:hypothetical protein